MNTTYFDSSFGFGVKIRKLACSHKLGKHRKNKNATKIKTKFSVPEQGL